MLQIPILRRGEPYTSLDVARVAHHRTREPFVEISQANAGLIRRDLLDQARGRAALAAFSTAELVSLCTRAADHFLMTPFRLGASRNLRTTMCDRFPQPPGCRTRWHGETC